MEIMVVVIIIMVFAAIGIPKYYDFVERSYYNNARKFMLDMYSAQLRFALYNNNLFTTQTDLLDAGLPIPQGYQEPTSGAAGGSMAYSIALAAKGQPWPVVTLQRLRPAPNNYRLTLLATGDVTCTDGGAGSTLCTKLGF